MSLKNYRLSNSVGSLALLSLLSACLLIGCSSDTGDGSSSSSSSSPTKLSASLQSWSNRNAAVFDGADSAIERAKTALGRAGAGGNAETIQSLDEARLQIQEVAHMQKSAAMSMQQGMDLMAIVEQQNQQLRADKAKLAKQKEILERREYIFSLGIIGSLATIIVILVKVFFGWRVRMVTAREDKVLKEQQIEINKLEIAERAIRLQIARRDVERPAQKPHVPTQIDAPSGVLIGPGVADAV